MRFVFEDQHYINTLEKLEALDAFLMDGDSPRFDLKAYDTETNGLLFHRNVMIGFSISVDKHSGYYIPFLEWVPDISSEKLRTINKVKQLIYEDGHLRDVWREGLTYPENVGPNEYQVPDFLKMFIRRWLTHQKVRLLMHNAPFDCNMTEYHTGVSLSDNLWIDNVLVKHCIDENTPQALKEIATLWKKELGFDPEEDERAEQTELGQSVIRNGGKWNKSTREVWRGDPWLVAKYGAKDTALTFGEVEVGLQKFEEQFAAEHFDWFFEKEVMPVCKEVVIPMKYGGIYIDVPYFEKLKIETKSALEKLEDEVQKSISEFIQNFDIGESREEAIKEPRIIKRIMELEGLEHPTQTVKGVTKKSLARKAVESAYQTSPHWLWGYLLGQDEIKYSSQRMSEIVDELYTEILGRRYRFNIRSAEHLRWLFCGKLGYDRAKLPQTDSATKDNPIPSMSAEVLEDFFLKEHAWVRPLLKFKKLDKLYGTYICPALELHNNGWLHMDMKQSGTVSGRFSCSGGFNLQTLPKVEELDRCPKCESKKIKITKPVTLMADLHCTDCGHIAEGILCPSGIKAGFIAPPGYKIINADYSSLEPRCFAFCSGDDKLKQIYREGLDLYSKIYCDMADKEGKYSAHPDHPNFLKKKNKAARDLFKPIALGIPYGAQANQVANLMNLKKTISIKDKETGEWKDIEVLDVELGKKYRDQYLSTYQDLHKYMLSCENDAISKGYVETLVGRRRHFLYTQYVYKLLMRRGIDSEDFLTAKHNSLKGKYAMDGALDEDALLAFCSHFDMSFKDVMGNDGWAYVRNLYKNELNNAKNMPIQGLAGHIANKGMLDTQRAFRKHGIDGYVFLQVHDEISSYAREDQAEKAAQLQKEAMERNEFALLVDIPMSAEPIICSNLKDSK